MDTRRGPERSGGSRRVELDLLLGAWLDAKAKKDPDFEEDGKVIVWDLNHEVVEVWNLWKMMEALDWRFLPSAGGMLDQPEALMEDLLTISWRRDVIESRRKAGLDPRFNTGPAPGDPALFKTRGSS